MELDETDEGILFLLRHDARRVTTQEMAQRAGVSASAVRNRIDRTESEEVIRGYYPDVNYDVAGLQLHVEFICTAPNPTRDRLAKEARDVSGVVSIREVLNAHESVQIDAVGTDSDDVARIADELSAIGLEVVNTKLIKESYLQPFNRFGQHLVEGVSDG